MYPTRAAIWREHCFENFLTWVNTVYAKSTWLACYGSEEEGWRWARLSAQAPPGETPSGAAAVFYLPHRRQLDGHGGAEPESVSKDGECIRCEPDEISPDEPSRW